MAGSLNHFIELDRNYRPLPLHRCRTASKKVCLRLQPPTKMCSASPCSPLRGFPSDDETKRCETKSLWRFIGISSKISPIGDEQANQPDLRIRRVPVGCGRAPLTPSRAADFTSTQDIRDSAGSRSEQRPRN